MHVLSRACSYAIGVFHFAVVLKSNLAPHRLTLSLNPFETTPSDSRRQAPPSLGNMRVKFQVAQQGYVVIIN